MLEDATGSPATLLVFAKHSVYQSYVTSLCALYIALASLQQCLEKQADPVIRLRGRQCGQQPQSGKAIALRHSEKRGSEGLGKYSRPFCCQNIEIYD